MSFLAFFDHFFSLGGAKEDDRAAAKKTFTKAIETLNIDVALAAHENWKYRLHASLEGNGIDELNPEKIACDHCCDFGKWIYGDGEEHLGKFAAFTELKATHQMFHYTASNVALLVKANKRTEAEELLEGEFARLSHRIESTLKDLKSLSRTN